MIWLQDILYYLSTLMMLKLWPNYVNQSLRISTSYLQGVRKKFHGFFVYLLSHIPLKHQWLATFRLKNRAFQPLLWRKFVLLVCLLTYSSITGWTALHLFVTAMEHEVHLLCFLASWCIQKIWLISWNHLGLSYLISSLPLQRRWS